MRSENVTITIGDNTVTAEFVRSEDCGYSAGRLLLDLPGGDVISIRRQSGGYLETRIRNCVAVRSTLHGTKAEALRSASEELLSESIASSVT